MFLVNDYNWNYVHPTIISRLLTLRGHSRSKDRGEEVLCSLNYVARFRGHRYAKLPERTMQRC